MSYVCDTCREQSLTLFNMPLYMTSLTLYNRTCFFSPPPAPALPPAPTPHAPAPTPPAPPTPPALPVLMSKRWRRKDIEE